jgi:hypothetical protein
MHYQVFMVEAVELILEAVVEVLVTALRIF